MKIHALLWALLIPVAASAQVKTHSATTTLGGWSGTMTYSSRMADGKEILEGKKSFSARSGEDSYLLEANYKNGQLDGAATAKLHRAFVQTGKDAGMLQVWKAALDVTLTARFYEGELSGLLTCNYIPSGSTKAGLADMAKQSFSANYTEGHVSGNYSYLSYSYPQKVVVNGATNAEGFADGKWQIYYPQVDELLTQTFQDGTETDDVSSAVRNHLAGRISERQLFDDYGYYSHVEELSFTEAAEYFDYILGSWLKDYKKVIPYEFGVKTWSGDMVEEVRDLHKVKVIRFTLPPTFSATGFDRFKALYYESLCGGKPLQGLALLKEGGESFVEVQPEVFPEWKAQVRNAYNTAPSGPVRLSLASYQADELRDEEAIDAVRRRFARSGEVLLEGNSRFKELLTSNKMPSDLIAGVRGAEQIAATCTEIKKYLSSVRNSLSGLEKTADGKFFIKDGVYYQNPGWDINLMMADADRIVAGCKEAARVYDAGWEYVAARPDVAASYKAFCGKVTTGTYEEVVGATADAAYFVEKVVTPDVLGKVGTREEMRQALSDKSYSHFVAVYPSTPAVSFKSRADVDEFVAKSLEYAGFQRSLLEFDTLVSEIRFEKAQLDAETSVKPYKSMAAPNNARLTTYSLQPSFSDVEGYAPVKRSLEECLAFLKDARDYISVHKLYLSESEQLRDLLSSSRTNHVSKFYRTLTKDFQLNWDPALPLGKCASDVREAIGITRRIAAAVSAPDAADRDKAIKGLTDKTQIWNVLERQ